MRVAFMGTPDFAVPPLLALHGAGHEIAGVFTQPDRPSGRGHRTAPPPVKRAAQDLGIPVFQFPRIRRQEGIDALRQARPDVVVTAAFGQILSRVLLAVPPLGTVNIHASLLPEYRGPAPINWAIIEGRAETGVTTMYTDAGIDTGDMIFGESTPIGDRETAGELTARLSRIGAGLILKTLEAIARGDAPRIPQDEKLATHRPMLAKENGLIDWTAPARAVDCLVRGVNPWPGGYTMLEGSPLKIWETLPADGSGPPGEILCADPRRGLIVACGEGAVEIAVLQAAGKGRMSARDRLRGHPLTEGIRLGGGA